MKIFEKALYHLYRLALRPLLPATTPVRYHGIPVGLDHKAPDWMFPTYRQVYADIPEYEATLICGIKASVRAGDRVAIIGAGYGATIVFAAMATGPEGSVTCYEASASAIRYSIEAAKRNSVEDRVGFIHAIVGQALKIYGKGVSRKVWPASELEECDVLELDCEGAELEILRGLSVRPRTILVETHGVYGSSTSDVESQLRQMGYAVTNMGPAEPRIAEKCSEWDLYVLLADRSAAAGA